MKKVALLGDSIREIGYGLKVPALLGDNYQVFQPNDNCRFCQYTLRMLFDYRDILKDCEVIHWNNGLWDSCRLYSDKETFLPEDVYLNCMLRIARILKSITPNVIFATTTPVRDEFQYNFNADIDRFNAILVPELKKMGIIINDLNALVKRDINAYIRTDDLLHLTEEGANVCAAQVVEFIKKFD